MKPIRLASEKRRTQLCGILMEYQKNSGRGSQPDTFHWGIYDRQRSNGSDGQKDTGYLKKN